MKLIIDISEGIYKHVDTIQNGSIGAKQIINSVKNGIPAYKAIPSAYKGMTNGQVHDMLYQMLVELKDGADRYGAEKWWNSPYEPQERSE